MRTGFGFACLAALRVVFFRPGEVSGRPWLKLKRRTELSQGRSAMSAQEECALLRAMGAYDTLMSQGAEGVRHLRPLLVLE